MIDFAQYLPVRTFLVQGDQALHESIVASMEGSYPTVHSLSVPRFTVDHAKTIAAFAIEGDGTDRVIVVYFAVFSPDAAQVLLKALEEPDMDTIVILVTPYPYIVPLTIRSRVTLLQTKRTHISPTTRTKAEAMEYIKKELASDSDEDAATRRANAIKMLDELEIASSRDHAKSRAIYEAKHMLFAGNLPTKFVMEYVVTRVL